MIVLSSSKAKMKQKKVAQIIYDHFKHFGLQMHIGSKEAKS